MPHSRTIAERILLTTVKSGVSITRYAIMGLSLRKENRVSTKETTSLGMGSRVIDPVTIPWNVAIASSP